MGDLDPVRELAATISPCQSLASNSRCKVRGSGGLNEVDDCLGVRPADRADTIPAHIHQETDADLLGAARQPRGYRNTETFITMIYLIAASLGDVVKYT